MYDHFSNDEIIPSNFDEFALHLITNLISITCNSMINFKTRAGTIRLSSDTMRIAIHAMRYDTYHDISAQIQQHLEAL